MLKLAIITISVLIFGCNSSQNDNSVIPAAIQTRHWVDFRHFPNTFSKRMSSDIIEVNGKQTSFLFILKSASSPINVIHKHDSAKVPPVQQSNSVDEPHILSHTVTKPVIQELREVISPYRRVVQEIRPVTEEVKTIVSTKSKAGPQITHQPKYQTIYSRKPMMETSNKHSKKNMIDYSLYTGTSDYDMKYVSPNIEVLSNLMNSENYLVYQTIRLYKDRK